MQCGIKSITRFAMPRCRRSRRRYPVVALLVLIASGKVKAHFAAIIALVLTNLIAIFLFTMPAGMSIRASLLEIVFGFFPIG